MDGVTPQDDPRRVLAAAATVDITPPVGIHLHNWAYSPYPVSTGIHRPLEAKIVALSDAEGRDSLLLISLDLGWWMSAADEWALRSAILERTGLLPQNVIVALTHTHSGPSIARDDAARPGGDLIGGYLDRIQSEIADASRDALSRLVPCFLDWTRGRCDLAVNRDLFRPDEQRFVVGANTDGVTDDTLVVGRIATEEGTLVAVVANYAVHATSLGGLNSLISPDLVGTARELVEGETGGVFLFLQGASGDLSPLDQYAADPTVADKNGRTLGFAVLSALSNMLEPGTRPQYSGTIESGAPLGTYAAVPSAVGLRLRPSVFEVRLPTQRNEPPATIDPAVLADRALRASRVRANVADSHTQFPVTMWEVGEATVIALPGEAYSLLQRKLRSEFPDKVLVFVNLANGAHMGYLAPEPAYDEGRYPAWQSPLGHGALELLISACRMQLRNRYAPTKLPVPTRHEASPHHQQNRNLA